MPLMSGLKLLIFLTCAAEVMGSSQLDILSQKDTFVGAPKTWHSYIHSFLCKFLSTLTEHTLFTTKYRAVLASWQFVRLNKKDKIIEYFGSCNDGNYIYRCYHAQYITTMRDPAGHWSLKNFGEWEEDVPCMVTFSYIWRMNLDTHFGINITIWRLFFSTAPSFCQKGNLTICAPTCQNKMLSFCQFISKESIFVPENNIITTMVVMNNVDFHISVFYSVMDRNILESYSVREISPGVKVASVNIAHLRAFLFTFLISVQPLRKIFVNVTNTKVNFDAYDGPGLKCRKLQANNQVYYCSSFQCLLLLVSSVHETVFYSVRKLALISIDVYERGNTSLSLPMLQCQSPTCVLSIHTAQHHVNATLTELVYNGHKYDSPACLFGGLMFFERPTELTKVTNALCEKHSSLKDNSRRFYSEKSSLTVLLFWYPQYASCHATLSLSMTLCGLVKINYCTFKTDQVISHASNSISGKAFGTTKIKHWQLRHAILGRAVDKNITNYGIMLAQDGCTVLKFEYGYFVEPLFSCHLGLFFDMDFASNSSLTFQVLGRFHSHLGFKCHDTQKDSVHLYHSHIDNLQVSFPNSVQKCKHLAFGRDRKYFTALNCHRAIFASHIENINFDITVQAPITLFKVSLAMVPQTRSWIQILLWKSTPKRVPLIKCDCFEELRSLNEAYPAAKESPRQHLLILSVAKHTDYQRTISIGVNFTSAKTREWILMWKAHYLLRYLRKEKGFTFHGKTESFQPYFSEKSKHMAKYLNVALKTLWVKNSYMRTQQECPAEVKRYGLRLRFTYFMMQDQEQFLLIDHFAIKFQRRQGHSWNGASKLCEAERGNLPAILNFVDLNRMLSLFKLSSLIPPTEAIYIGLRNPTQPAV